MPVVKNSNRSRRKAEGGRVDVYGGIPRSYTPGIKSGNDILVVFLRSKA